MLTRRSALLFPFVLAACAGDDDEPVPAIITTKSTTAAITPPPRQGSFPPLTYDYLMRLPLNVAEITTDVRFLPAGEGADIAARDPVPPIEALLRMGQDRLQAAGSAGRAVFVINDASIVRAGGGLAGHFAVQLDITAPDNSAAGFAAAEVSRRVEGAGSGDRQALYDMSRQMMDAMNVEFEYQVRRSLKDWLVAPAATAPQPVQQEALPPPSTQAAPPTPLAPPLVPPTAAPLAPPSDDAPAARTDQIKWRHPVRTVAGRFRS